MIDAEIAIIAQLKTAISNAKAKVMSSAALAGTSDIASLCPLVVVHPGQVPTAAISYSGDSFREEQEWHVFIIVKLIADPVNHSTTYQEAAPLLLEVAQGLSGFNPDAKTLSPFKYIERDEVDVSAGIAKFRLVFKWQHNF